MTLDEYKAAQKKFRLVPDFTTRKVANSDAGDWAKIPLTKEDADAHSRHVR